MEAHKQINIKVLKKVNLSIFVLMSLLLFGFAGVLDDSFGAWVDRHRLIIAVLWLFQGSWIVAEYLEQIQRVIQKILAVKTQSKRAQKAFLLISASQKQIIKDLYATGKVVHRSLNPENPQVQLLEHERFILRTEQYGSNGHPYYRLAPWVILYLRENDNFLST